ncbi:unnamed protein product [Polarella glacialis]|uniref:Uncharacterized protein n=1 Tax=Polarella glacialis TaxID=89957 RepID=A0A813DW15_POLGL|nr:unnamed protein product [Polarella glacialis]
MAVIVSKRFVIEAPHMNQPWVPEVKEIEDMVFVKVHKWDRHFIKFVSSKVLNVARQNPANVAFVDELMKLRNCACDVALIAAMGSPEDEEAPKKKQRIRKANEGDGIPLPAWVTIECSDLIGTSEGNRSMKVLVEGIRTSAIWVELLPMNLDYIRRAILTSEARGRHWKPKGQAADDQESSEILPEA